MPKIGKIAPSSAGLTVKTEKALNSDTKKKTDRLPDRFSLFLVTLGLESLTAEASPRIGVFVKIRRCERHLFLILAPLQEQAIR